MKPFCISIFSIFSSISIVYANEYRSNNHFLFLFTPKQGNVHENYAFCSKLGMNLISINTEKDENTARSQENPKIDWIWIESTFRNQSDECPSKCCAMQMKASKGKKEVEFRVDSCSSISAYMACQQVCVFDTNISYYNIISLFHFFHKVIIKY